MGPYKDFFSMKFPGVLQVLEALFSALQYKMNCFLACSKCRLLLSACHCVLKAWDGCAFVLQHPFAVMVRNVHCCALESIMWV